MSLKGNQGHVVSVGSRGSTSLVVGVLMAAKQMEEIQKKVRKISYPRANAPAQSLLFAGMERYALLEWLFFKLISLFLSDFIFLLIPEQCGGEFPQSN